MFCPECGTEYVPGCARCADCDVPLVETKPEKSLAASEKPDDASAQPLDLVTVLASGDSGLIAIAKSLLESAEIPFTVRGEGVQDLFGAGRLFGGFNILVGPIAVQVLAQDADEARLVLEDLLNSRDARPGEESDSDDT